VAALRNDLFLQLAGQPEVTSFPKRLFEQSCSVLINSASQQNDGCLSFRQENTAPWTCLHQSRLVRLSVGLGVYESNLTHFTYVLNNLVAFALRDSNTSSVVLLQDVCRSAGLFSHTVQRRRRVLDRLVMPSECGVRVMVAVGDRVPEQSSLSLLDLQ